MCCMSGALTSSILYRGILERSLKVERPLIDSGLGGQTGSVLHNYDNLLMAGPLALNHVLTTPLGWEAMASLAYNMLLP